MAGRQKRIVGNAKEDWWKSSERIQDDQWQKQYDMNRQQFDQEMARKRTAQQRNEQAAVNIKKLNAQKTWEDEYKKRSRQFKRSNGN